MMKVLLAAAVVFGLAFAPIGQARADSTTDFAAKLVAMMEQMASIVETNKADCNAMGDKLDKFMTDNAAFFKEAKARAEKMSDDEKHALETRYRTRVQAVIVKLREGLSKCATNPKVLSAIQKVQ